MFVYPLQIDLQALVRVNRGPEHAEPTGLADGNDHIAAVGEGEDGVFNSEHFCDLGWHAVLLNLFSPVYNHA